MWLIPKITKKSLRSLKTLKTMETRTWQIKMLFVKNLKLKQFVKLRRRLRKHLFLSPFTELKQPKCQLTLDYRRQMFHL